MDYAFHSYRVDVLIPRVADDFKGRFWAIFVAAGGPSVGRLWYLILPVHLARGIILCMIAVQPNSLFERGLS
jgi:hypothetical protein